MNRRRRMIIELGVLLVTAFAFYQYLTTITFVLTAESTRARISTIDKQWQCHRDAETQRERCAWHYSPLFTFLDLQERPHTIRSDIGTKDSQLYRAGDQVEVLFDAQYPGTARINRFTELWFRPMFFSVWSLVVIIAYLIWTRKQPPSVRRAWMTWLIASAALLPLIILINAALL